LDVKPNCTAAIAAVVLFFCAAALFAGPFPQLTDIEDGPSVISPGPPHPTWGFSSVLPPLIAIAMALILRQVLISLFVGVLLGALLQNGFHPLHALLRTADHYLLGALSTEREPTGITSARTLASDEPRRMIAPAPNCFSIWLTARSIDRDLSLLSCTISTPQILLGRTAR